MNKKLEKTIKELQEEYTFRKVQGTLPFRIMDSIREKSAPLTLKPVTQEEFEENYQRVVKEHGVVSANKVLGQIKKEPITLKEWIAYNGKMLSWKTWG